MTAHAVLARFPAQSVDEAFDASVAPFEAVAVDQVLVNRLGVPPLTERQFDGVESRAHRR